MSHPYKSHAHHNDPKWLKGLAPFKETAVSREGERADLKATQRNHGVDEDPKALAEAAYETKDN